MTDDDVVALTVRTVRLISGSPRVIQSHPGEKAPAEPYLVVTFIGTSEVRENQVETEYSETDGEVTATPVMETEWHFSLHAVGAGGSGILRRVAAGAQLLQTQELMNPLLIHEVSDVRSLPEFIQNAWQPRAQADLFLRGLTRDGFVIIPIDEASFTINGQSSGPISS